MAAGTPRAAADIPLWYHTFELPDGTVTPGLFDHRGLVGKLPIPPSLEGRRCLDLASADGFFAFEMARRGGTVTSVDLEDAGAQDWQGEPGETERRGTGARERFELVRELTGLDVERVDLNLYDVSPEALGGAFDFVFMGNVLLHVSDPARVLRNVRSVTAGRFLCFETISLTLTLTRPFTAAAALSSETLVRWWTPNLRAHRRLLTATGFEIEDGRFPVFQRFGTGTTRRPSLSTLRRDEPLKWLSFWALTRWTGVPCAWTLCR